jgi:hypothetical protein
MKFTVPAKPFAAAMLCMAKRDIRYYLNGVMVDKQEIISTDGRMLYQHETAEVIHDKDGGFIIDFIGKVPLKADSIEFNLNDSNLDGVAYCKCGLGQIISAVYFKVIEGNYPKIKERNIICRNEIKPTVEIGIDSRLLSTLDKVVKLVGNPKFHMVHLHLAGPDKSMIFDINGHRYKSTVVIMPARL